MEREEVERFIYLEEFASVVIHKSIMFCNRIYKCLFICVLILVICNDMRVTAVASSNIQPNENSHRLRARPYLRLPQRPFNQYSRLKADEFLDDDDFFEMNKRQTSDDYGHLRFGKRDEFDDYGHMRFGRSGSDTNN